MSSSDASPIALPPASNPGSHSVRFGFENTYARLPEYFYQRWLLSLTEPIRGRGYVPHTSKKK